MQTPEQIKKRLGEFLKVANPRSVVTDLEQAAEFVEVHSLALGYTVACSTCPGTLQEAFRLMHELLDNFDEKFHQYKKTMQPTTNKHKAKKDRLLYITGLHAHKRSKDMSDAEIIQCIALNENMAKQFDLAEGWEKEVAAYKATLKKGNKKQDQEGGNKEPEGGKPGATVAGVLQVEPEKVEEQLKSLGKKALNVVAKKLSVSDYVSKSEEEVIAELLARHASETATQPAE